MPLERSHSLANSIVYRSVLVCDRIALFRLAQLCPIGDELFTLADQDPDEDEK